MCIRDRLCTHIKDPRAERAKLLFSFVIYATFWCLVLFNKKWHRFARQFTYSYVGLITDFKRVITLRWILIYNSPALVRPINRVQITEHSYDETLQGTFGSKRKAKNSNLRETAIACHNGYGWLPVLKEHLIAVESSIFIALWKIMVWSNCIISRVCAQQAIILFLKWSENSEIFIEKKMLKTNWVVRHQENFELPWRDGEQWWRCGDKKSSSTRQCGPGSISRFCVICGLSFI